MKPRVSIEAVTALLLAALPVATGPAFAQAAASDTVKTVIEKGATFDMMGQAYVFAARADGSYADGQGQVAGKYRADGANLCVTPGTYPQERCFAFPPGKKSGDSFEAMSDSGPVKVTIR